MKTAFAAAFALGVSALALSPSGSLAQTLDKPSIDSVVQVDEELIRETKLALAGHYEAMAFGGMGGPLEEVTTKSTSSRDSSQPVATASGKEPGSLAAGEIAAPGAKTLDSMTGGESAGVGGPVESRSGYPPCDPGPGDDRCIQLYERGVTGAGN